MVRSFLTRLVDSVTRSLLLALCLAICLACATPFPIESLEEGMTAETVRENFGAPIKTKRGGPLVWTTHGWEDELSVSTWTYFPEKFFPVFWSAGNRVVLYFEDERLAHWEVIEPIHSSGGVTFDSFNSMGSMDSSHHSKGHTHHHHGC